LEHMANTSFQEMMIKQKDKKLRKKYKGIATSLHGRKMEVSVWNTTYLVSINHI